MFFRFLSRALCSALFCVALSPARADTVLDWAQLSAELQRGLPITARLRIRVLGDLAVFNALNAIEPRYQAYGPPLAHAPQASPEAAVAAAQWTVLAAQPEISHERLRTAYREALARIPESSAKARGVALGQLAATGMLASRAQDHEVRAQPTRRDPGPGVFALLAGQHQEAPVTFGSVRPVAVRSIARFDPGQPPAPRSAGAVGDIAEIKALGARDSRTRSTDQTVAALFWDSTQDSDALALFAAIARAQHATPLQTARMLALTTMAEFDAGIAIMAFKDKYRYWRPSSAISGPHAEPSLRDAAWEPLLRTPPHPDYPSGGGVVGGVYERILEHFDPAGAASLSLTSRNMGHTRHWPHPQALAQELALSRMWGGIHFRGTVDASLRIGRGIADEVLATQLQPLRARADVAAERRSSLAF